MSNTIYQETIAILKNSGLPTSSHKKYLRKNYTTLWAEIQREITHFDINNATINETLFVLQTGMSDFPKCHCGKSVNWHCSRNKYSTYCSHACSTEKVISAAADKKKSFDYMSVLPNDYPDTKKDLLHAINEILSGTRIDKLKHIIMRDDNVLWAKIIVAVPHIDTRRASIREIMYALKHDLISIPNCTMCENKVKWDSGSQKYKEFCSGSCSAKYTFSKYNAEKGVANASQLASVKEKKKETFTEKYGVDNLFKHPEFKQKLKDISKERWARIYGDKNFTVDGMSYTQYRHRVDQYSNTQYEWNKHTIDPEGKRSKDWHLDHIYSVNEAFMNKVPINITGDITNLRIISSDENNKKKARCDKTLEQLFEDYENKKGT